MPLTFKKAFLTGVFAAAALLGGCDMPMSSVTLTAADGNAVTTSVPVGAKPVTLVMADGAKLSCVETYMEATTGAYTDLHHVVCAETKDVVQARKAYAEYIRQGP
jgi:hypothetical protein